MNSERWNNRNRFMRGRSNRGGSGRGGRDWPYRVPPNFSNRGGFRGSRPPNFVGKGINHQWTRFKREMPTKRLSEFEIGVTEYVNKENEGFNGIIKSRYSDFQVSEINEKGEIAKLTDMEVPKPPTDDTVDEDEDLLLSKYNLEILPMDTWDRINKIALSTEPSNEKVEIDVTGMTKEQRTKIHDAVKKAFAESIVGSTVTVDDKKFVCFVKYKKGVRIDNRVKWVWPGEYVHFIVHKENCDTMDAAIRIADRLKMNLKPAMFGYAGTKDRRAKTSQWFSVRRVDPRRVAAAARQLRDVRVRVGNYRFSDTHLQLGMLKGNQFRITLRNVTAADEVVSQACALLRERGFLNYYGLQRFGTRADSPTYTVGLKLLQNDFKGAIDAVLSEREGPLQAALRAYKESGAEEACLMLPKYAPNCSIEMKLIRTLAKNPNDLVGAFSQLARNTRLLYLHSYQSLVWNRAVSERARRHGLAPAPGDLVPLQDLHEDVFIEETDVDKSEEQSDTDTDPTGEEDPKPEDKPAEEAPKQPVKEKNAKDPKAKVPVKVLTEEDVKSGRYTIYDVVLPLPGYNIEYPPNMKEFYEQELAKDGLTLEMRHKIKSYSMSGAYRRMAVRPSGVRWQCVRYTDPCADLQLSDYDELEGRVLDGILPDGKYKALLLTMSLPASSYATMALRELLKVDTSCDNQALQNNYHKLVGDKTLTTDTTSETADQKIQSDVPDQNERSQSDVPDQHDRSQSDVPDQHDQSQSDVPDRDERSQSDVPDQHDRSQSDVPDRDERSQSHVPDQDNRSQSNVPDQDQQSQNSVDPNQDGHSEKSQNNEHGDNENIKTSEGSKRKLEIEEDKCVTAKKVKSDSVNQ